MVVSLPVQVAQRNPSIVDAICGAGWQEGSYAWKSDPDEAHITYRPTHPVGKEPIQVAKIQWTFLQAAVHSGGSTLQLASRVVMRHFPKEKMNIGLLAQEFIDNNAMYWYQYQNVGPYNQYLFYEVFVGGGHPNTRQVLAGFLVYRYPVHRRTDFDHEFDLSKVDLLGGDKSPRYQVRPDLGVPAELASSFDERERAALRKMAFRTVQEKGLLKYRLPYRIIQRLSCASGAYVACCPLCQQKDCIWHHNEPSLVSDNIAILPCASVAKRRDLLYRQVAFIQRQNSIHAPGYYLRHNHQQDMSCIVAGMNRIWPEHSVSFKPTVVNHGLKVSSSKSCSTPVTYRPRTPAPVTTSTTSTTSPLYMAAANEAGDAGRSSPAAAAFAASTTKARAKASSGVGAKSGMLKDPPVPASLAGQRGPSETSLTSSPVRTPALKKMMKEGTKMNVSPVVISVGKENNTKRRVGENLFGMDFFGFVPTYTCSSETRTAVAKTNNQPSLNMFGYVNLTEEARRREHYEKLDRLRDNTRWLLSDRGQELYLEDHELQDDDHHHDHHHDHDHDQQGGSTRTAVNKRVRHS